MHMIEGHRSALQYDNSTKTTKQVVHTVTKEDMDVREAAILCEMKLGSCLSTSINYLCVQERYKWMSLMQ